MVQEAMQQMNPPWYGVGRGGGWGMKLVAWHYMDLVTGRVIWFVILISGMLLPEKTQAI